ncbi:MAG: hypothetical protein KAH54_03235 [Candidatus Sabulitectum sp.]|nr:hypothetical protein [Candidatus Sabulitectum sp.]
MKECLEIYSLTGYIQTGPEFMVELGIDFYDIAYYDAKWWFACNDSSFPIRAYNGSGVLMESIPSSALPSAYGITFDSSGNLWVSNINTDEIYRLEDVTALTRTTWATIKTTY